MTESKPHKRWMVFALVGVLLVIALLVLTTLSEGARTIASYVRTQGASTALSLTLPFHYEFRIPGVLEETGTPSRSSSPYWWLNSGGRFILAEGVGKTVQGELPTYQKWRVAYALSSAADTDDGYHPQNLLRILTRTAWRNVAARAYFRITADRLSESPNRNESNGLLLMSRYRDGDNLYYAGVRVDGDAVIKKKKDGVYYTLAQTEVFEGAYDQNTSPNLLPHNTWIGLKIETEDTDDGGVIIRLYTDIGRTNTWTFALEAHDDSSSFGGTAHRYAGWLGIRTDFMDVEFDDFWIIPLN